MSNKSPLPFNPISEEYTGFKTWITPPMAKYILEHHNNDNRKIYPHQVNDISKSIETVGWLKDGKGICFNVEGNITEKQHTLSVIAKEPDDSKPFEMIVVLGVVTDAFSKAKLDKPRTPHDEIYRKDRSVESSQSAILGDVLKRKKGQSLTINNAVVQWRDWKDDIKKASELCRDFMFETSDFSAQKKTLGAWATLCVRENYNKEVETFLDLLTSELKVVSSSRLTKDFVKFWKENTWNESNEGRLTMFYKMLCVATDRLIKEPDGTSGLDLNIDKLGDTKMESKGVYRKFLDGSKKTVQLPF